MFETTINLLSCSANGGRCRCPLDIEEQDKISYFVGRQLEIDYGYLLCSGCETSYPILSGVALLVPDVCGYLKEHARAIAKYVTRDQLPARFRDCFPEEENSENNSEWDLESDRVSSWYIANHYLDSRRLLLELQKNDAMPSPFLTNLIREFWDVGPFSLLERYLSANNPSDGAFIDLGCNVGGSIKIARQYNETCLGIDLSFTAIKFARQINLNVRPDSRLCIPGDRLSGVTSLEISTPQQSNEGGFADFIVGNLQSLPVKEGIWRTVASMSIIDMLKRPEMLPVVQNRLLEDSGSVVHMCPYVWSEETAHYLRGLLPTGFTDSARAVENLYQSAGFEIHEAEYDIPWLFFKHKRQIEFYALHAFCAIKTR
jgi:hypothetical protein